jgi:PAS domain S-box-containing protein
MKAVTEKYEKFFSKVLLILIVGFHMLMSPIISAQSTELPDVLVLHSYHQQFKWTGDITQGVESILEGKCNLQVQYMDTKRQFDEEYQQILFDLIYHKHKKHDYDVIIASDNNAIDFLKSFHDTIFGDVPIVFCGVNYAKPYDFAEFPNITGVSEEVDIEKNFKLIKKLQPNVNKLFIITDETPTGKVVKEEISGVIQQNENLYKVVEVTNYVSMRDLELRLKQLTPDYAVLFTLFFRDSENKYFSYGEAARRIAASSNNPVFCLWDFYLNYGVAGGFVADGFAQGQEAGKIVLEILNGKKPSEIPIVWDSPNHYKFDYNILRKYNIDFDLLPENSKIINEPYSLYKDDRQLFWQIFVTIVLLSVLSVLLIVSAILRHRLNIKIKEKNTYLSTILNSVGEGIIDVDNRKRIRGMNPVAEIITGYTESESIGRFLEEIFPVQKKSSKPGHDIYYLLTNRTGYTFKVSYTESLFKSKGKNNGYVIAFSDVTQIVDNEERYSRLTENARDVIYRISIPEGIFEYVSPASKEILGYTPDELYLHPELMKSFISDDWKRYIFRKWYGAKNGTIDHIVEFQIKDKSGGTKWINQRSVLVYDGEGKPVALEGIMTDVTTAKETENQLRESLIALEEAKERAEESDQLKSAFLANIAHEIRTPMNGIIGFSQLLRDANLAKVSQKKYIDIIQKSSERMLNIIDDLVNIAQIESGQARTKVKEVRLDVFINHLHDQFETKAENNDIDLILKDKDSLNGRVIMTDHYKLDYAIRKLLSNAIKYTSKGSVSYSLLLEENILKFSVTDTGIGISIENQKKIFERFVQADNSPFKAEEGAGLGLSIARSFIEMLGGEIKLKSKPGKGSKFYFQIPVEVKS